MQYGEGKLGRIFALRLENGDRLPDTVETFAREHGLERAFAVYLGGAADGSRMVVGPQDQPGDIVPMIHTLTGSQEVLALGTIFPNEAGEPILHMHAASGRAGGASVGCTRAGVDVWLVGEVILMEILGIGGQRRQEAPSGFQLLQF
jgi:predicted DNA-binding protein with PD1-like motif